MFTACLLVALAVGQVGGGADPPTGESPFTPPESTGTFFALPFPNGFETLWRINSEGYVDHVGERGDLATPRPWNLVYDWTHERLYATDVLTRTWVRINPLTGRGTTLGPTGSYFPSQIAFCEQDGFVYGTTGENQLAKIDPNNGHTTVIADGLSFQSVVCVEGFLGEYDGLIVNEGGTLVNYTLPDLERIVIGGQFRRGTSMMLWDPVNKTLFGFDRDNNSIAQFDPSTGTDEFVFTVQQWFPSPNVIVFASGDVFPWTTCQRTDSDIDGDIDLRDFGNYQNCWTGPHE